MMYKLVCRVVVMLCVVLSGLGAQTIEKGWHLMGFPMPTSIEAIKKAYDLKDVRRFDEDSQSWQSSGQVGWNEGVLLYTPKRILIESTLDSVKSSAGVRDKAFSIVLQKGWNLKSITPRISVMSKLFGDDVVIWLYENNEWSSYLPKSKDDQINQQPIIKNAQGFFIYSPTDRTYPLRDLQRKLTQFSNSKQMMDFLEKSVIFSRAFRSDDDHFGIAEGDGVSAPSSAGAKQSVDDATHTNIQEQGVDEADIIKHDNNRLFYIATDDNDQRSLYTHSFAHLISGQGRAEKITVFTGKAYDKKGVEKGVEKRVEIEGIYLYNDQLIVLGRGYYPYGGIRTANRHSRMVLPPYYQNEDFYIEVYDVKDSKNINRTQQITMRGYLKDTRLADGKLYVVSSYNPYFKVAYKRAYIRCKDGVYQLVDSKGRCYELDYDAYTVQEKHILPTMSINGKAVDWIDYKSFYSKMSVDRQNSIITTTVFDLKQTTMTTKSVSLMANSYTTYMSPYALYLTYQHYDAIPFVDDSSQREDSTQTTIYKIALGERPDFVDHIVIDGRTLNQFAFSEYKGVLRVATTKGYSWNDSTDNMVYTIQEEGGVLKQQGLLKGLGKKGEAIRSVRFMGDKAFVVTFKQTDPFYTIDLSKPTNPQKIGELSIPGFSTYLHDVGDDKILALGNDADDEGRVTAMQVQLFDVANFAKPQLLDKYLFDKSSFSNALYNHKAFTFRRSDKRFALYVNNYDYKSNATTFRGFYLFGLQNGSIKEPHKINLATKEDKGYGYYDARSMIFSKDGKHYILFLSKDLQLYPIAP